MPRSRSATLRIVGGRLKGRRLSVSAATIRPTQERVREALFARWHGRLSDARFLDLYCGSGVVGIEGSSRGARVVGLVDQDIRVATRNWQTLISDPPLALKALLPQGLSRWPSTWPAEWDLIFADPPYALDSFDRVVEAACQRLAQSAELCLEHSRHRPAPREVASGEMTGERRYGDTCLTFYRRRTTPG